mmetsp:Transcript_23834/g.37979  ORF Transcript_23834/g.37979 Transcript_23834/m.37979 type:complete len:363 (-) Transcript_23834:611-1699(-)
MLRASDIIKCVLCTTLVLIVYIVIDDPNVGYYSTSAGYGTIHSVSFQRNANIVVEDADIVDSDVYDKEEEGKEKALESKLVDTAPEESSSGVECSALTSTSSAVDKANCAYDFSSYYTRGQQNNESESNGNRIVIYGRIYGGAMSTFTKLSGCPLIRPAGSPGCIHYKGCTFTSKEVGSVVTEADVVIMDHRTAKKLFKKHLLDKVLPRYNIHGRRLYRVVYMREAYYYAGVEVQKEFDFVMGIHSFNPVVNPNFFERPARYQLTNSRIKNDGFSSRPKFAMSLISHCGKYRQRYIDKMVTILGSSKVHQFGRCGDGHRAPKKPLSAARKIASTYKFYLSFENTVQEGYTTEKLFKALEFVS